MRVIIRLAVGLVALVVAGAANGDTLVAAMAGTATPTTAADYRIVVRATFVGGTGRFAGASGHADGLGTADLGAGTITGHFTGTLVR